MKKLRHTWDVPQRMICALPLSKEYWCYMRFGLGGVFVYPLSSRSGLLPKVWFKGLNWRWLVEIPSDIPNGLTFCALLEAKEDTWYENSARWCFDQLLNEFEVSYASIRYQDGTWGDAPENEYPEAKAILLAEPEITKIWKTDSLVDFLRSKHQEMTIIDRSMAPLLDSYDTPEPEAPTETIIEVWMAPELEEPEQTFEDFILDTLMEADLGAVGEYADMKDYRFASCDVSDPAKAAKALLKAFKKAGYTTGIEIKERDGKERVWKLG